jgi:hypothetical protein
MGYIKRCRDLLLMWLGKGKALVAGVRDWSQVAHDKEAHFLNSHAARVGTLVGLLDGVKRTGKGRIGTIERTYGHPDDLAMDVRFDDGSVELYWYDELARVVRSYDGGA